MFSTVVSPNSKTSKMKPVFLLLLFPLGLISTGTLYCQGKPRKITPALERELRSRGSADFLILLREQADVSTARHLPSKEARGRHVFEQTRAVAERTQGALLSYLKREEMPYRSFFVVNAVLSAGTLAQAQDIARRPEVASLQRNPRFELDALPSRSGSRLSPRSAEVEWGLSQIGAKQVWEMGFTGQGVVVGGQDTGYDWDHPALLQSYRGWNGFVADHNYNWHDAIHAIDSLNGPPYEAAANPCGLDSPLPCDDNSHGTHTMGIITGSESNEGHKIGVAPDAEWIGCRNMERGWGSPASYMECFEWFLAPTELDGQNPDPGRAPHVINNSWACPAIEGCTPENFSLLQAVVDHLRAAGIVVVVSAGNSGSACGSIQTPAAIFANSFTVGATKRNDTIANFSSRGVVRIDSSGRLKPNVSAPGVDILSAVPNGGFTRLSGTSMAGPHVAGAAALLISAKPELAGQVELIEDLLEQTARPMLSAQDCDGVSGSEVPNAAYGYGRIDVLAAVEKALGLTAAQESNSAVRLSVAPNPAKAKIHIASSAPLPEAGQLRLFNAQGQIIREWAWPAGQTGLEVNIDEASSGLLLLQLRAGASFASRKILKQ